MMKTNYIDVNNLKVASELFKFVNEELLKNTNIKAEKFWSNFDKSVHELAPKNNQLLKIREDLQKKINEWHLKNKNSEFNIDEYKNFLKKIGYLVNEGSDFKIDTKNVDIEITSIAGPQLVVPIMNARYTLNAANARWVSLYDSLYGTDIIESEEGGSERYDPNRGQEVIKYVREFFDKYIPINGTSWKNIAGLKIVNKELIILKDDYEYKLKDANKFVGHRGDANKPEAVILQNNKLHFEIIINPRAFSAPPSVNVNFGPRHIPIRETPVIPKANLPNIPNLNGRVQKAEPISLELRAVTPTIKMNDLGGLTSSMSKFGGVGQSAGRSFGSESFMSGF